MESVLCLDMRLAGAAPYKRREEKAVGVSYNSAMSRVRIVFYEDLVDTMGDITILKRP